MTKRRGRTKKPRRKQAEAANKLHPSCVKSASIAERRLVILNGVCVLVKNALLCERVRPGALTTKSAGASEWDDREKRGGEVGEGRG